MISPDCERELIVGGRRAKDKPPVLPEVRLHCRLELNIVTEMM